MARPDRRGSALRGCVGHVVPLAVLAMVLLVPAGAASAQQATLVLDSLSEAGEAASRLPFGLGEELRYKVKLGIFSTGEAIMTVPRIDTVGGFPTYAVEWHIKGGPSFYRIDDRFLSWMDVETMAARRFIKDQRIGDRKRYRAFDFFPEERRVQRIDHDTTWAIPTSHPLDDVSFVYFARTLPLEVGETYTFDRFYKEEGNPVVLKVLRKDRRKVGAGEFNTIVVQPIIQTNGLFSEGGDAEIHFSDDERRLVVYLKADMPLINLTMHLEEIREGLR